MPESKSPKTHGDEAQFLRLFLASERELQRYVMALVPNREDAQEIVQQTAIALWEKFEQYDVEQPFTPWACRFGLIVTKQWIARQRRWKGILDGGLADELVRRRRELLPAMDDRLHHLDECLRGLSAPDRTVLDGYYFRQRPVDTLAVETGRSIAAIYKWLQRIRHRLRECIERKCEESP